MDICIQRREARTVSEAANRWLACWTCRKLSRKVAVSAGSTAAHPAEPLLPRSAYFTIRHSRSVPRSSAPTATNPRCANRETMAHTYPACNHISQPLVVSVRFMSAARTHVALDGRRWVSTTPVALFTETVFRRRTQHSKRFSSALIPTRRGKETEVFFMYLYTQL